ncbi:hypothetical protein Tco_0718375 [Tanacetum coccineum]
MMPMTLRLMFPPWRVMSPLPVRNSVGGIAIPTGLKRYTDPAIGLRMKRTNRKCRIPIDLYPPRVEEKSDVKRSGRKIGSEEGNDNDFKDGTILDSWDTPHS